MELSQLSLLKQITVHCGITLLRHTSQTFPCPLPPFLSLIHPFFCSSIFPKVPPVPLHFCQCLRTKRKQNISCNFLQYIYSMHSFLHTYPLLFSAFVLFNWPHLFSSGDLHPYKIVVWPHASRCWLSVFNASWESLFGHQTTLPSLFKLLPHLHFVSKATVLFCGISSKDLANEFVMWVVLEAWFDRMLLYSLSQKQKNGTKRSLEQCIKI